MPYTQIKKEQLIKTNINTFNVINNLNKITNKYKDKNFAILPDFPGFWAAYEKINPLSIDWVNYVELPAGKPRYKIKNEIKYLVESGGIIILQKFNAHGIHYLEKNIKSKFYHPIYYYIKDNFKIINEFEHYYIYGKTAN